MDASAPICLFCDKHPATDEDPLLCSDCLFWRNEEVRRVRQILHHCDELIARSRNPSTRDHRFRLAIQVLEQLMRYDLLGIPTILPRPCQQVVEYRELLEEHVAAYPLAQLAGQKARTGWPAPRTPESGEE